MAMFNNPYNSNYYLENLRSMRDGIDKTMQQYQQSQMQQPVQPITQNFQISPAQSNFELEAKYANNIDEVKNTFVIKTGIFATRDFSTIWVKDNLTGKIKTFNTEEVIEMDEKDKMIKEQTDMISSLQKQINELKGVILNATNDNADVTEQTTTKKSTGISNNTKSSK